MQITETVSSTQRLYGLHELVLSALEDRIQSEDVSLKDIEIAMKFLKDNNIAVDLSKELTAENTKNLMASIPRLTDAELQL